MKLLILLSILKSKHLLRKKAPKINKKITTIIKKRIIPQVDLSFKTSLQLVLRNIFFKIRDNTDLKSFWIIDVSEHFDETKLIYFISLVASDAGKYGGKGVPRKAFYIFDVKSEMELKRHGIIFLSCQDLLLEYFKEQTGTNGEGINVYDLVKFYIERNPNGYYFLDEVPLIQGGSYCLYL